MSIRPRDIYGDEEVRQTIKTWLTRGNWKVEGFRAVRDGDRYIPSPEEYYVFCVGSYLSNLMVGYAAYAHQTDRPTTPRIILKPRSRI